MVAAGRSGATTGSVPDRVAALRSGPGHPPLVRFAQKFARNTNKRIESVPADVMTALTQYEWPGNVRELENAMSAR
jgi:transcriptional regulator with PAS, ATPase and Fis domain